MNHIVNLLPQSSEMIFDNPRIQVQALSLLNSLLREMQVSLDSFIANEFDKFDAHVGETCCQTRAYQILLLHYQFKKQFTPYQINNLRKRISQITQFLGEQVELFENLKDSGVFVRQTLKAFLEKNHANIELPQPFFYLLTTYFLCRTKYFDSDGMTHIDYKRVARELNVSAWTGKRLIQKFERYVANESCNFLEKRVNSLPELQALLPELLAYRKKGDNDREAFPDYVTIRVIMTHLRHTKQPIVFSVVRYKTNGKLIDEVSMLARFSDQRGMFVLEKTHSFLFSKKPCVVVRGCVRYANKKHESKTEFVDRFVEAGIENIMLSNAAIHPQYSSGKLLEFRDNPFQDQAIEAEFLKMKAFAETFGCGKSAPHLFLTQHVLCDVLGKQLRASHPLAVLPQKIAKMAGLSKPVVA